MIATGTGIAPFASLVRDPELYDKYKQVMLIHTCRDKAELAFGKDLVDIFKDPLIGEFAIESLVYLPTTRESSDVIGGDRPHSKWKIILIIICFSIFSRKR